MARHALSLALTLVCGLAMAQTGATPGVSAESVLERLGYSASGVSVTLRWSECPRRGDDEVYGAHVVSTDGSPAFDLYFDSDGRVLDEAERRERGLTEKRWEWRAVTQPGRPGAADDQVKQAPAEAPKFRGKGLHIPVLTLPAPDVEGALFEDEMGVSTPHKGVLRTGVFIAPEAPVRVYPGNAELGVWETLPDGGRLWTLVVQSPGAVGLRLHFSMAEIAEGGSLVIGDAQGEGAAATPLRVDGAGWSPTCFSESVRVEYYLPPGADWVPGNPLLLELDRAAYHYRSFDQLLKQGFCHNDATCFFPLWQSAASAVGGIGSVGADGMVWCTGSLLNVQAGATLAPYFLTADHCVSTVAAADSIEVYWFFGSLVCNEAPLLPTEVPRTTGGADLLAHSSAEGGTDVSFMRLRQEPPAESARAGFTTDPVNAGTPVVGIHHPQGTYKRISFGTTTNSEETLSSDPPPLTNFLRVLWNNGTTEAGSSGSPIFLEDSMVVVGQLYGGLASCERPEEPDNYGRLEKSYPLLSPWLAGTAGPDYALSISVEGLGHVLLDESAEEIQSKTLRVGQGVAVAFRAVPDMGQRFKGWTVNGEVFYKTTKNMDLVIEQDTQVVAVFKQKGFFLCGPGFNEPGLKPNSGDLALGLCLMAMLVALGRVRRQKAGS